MSLAANDLRLAELEPRIFALQAEKEEIFHQYEELTRSRDVAKETYLTLARKLDEERISTAGPSTQLKLASVAAVPELPSRTSLPLLLILGATAGLLISVALVILRTWWRQINSPAH